MSLVHFTLHYRLHGSLDPDFPLEPGGKMNLSDYPSSAEEAPASFGGEQGRETEMGAFDRYLPESFRCRGSRMEGREIRKEPAARFMATFFSGLGAPMLTDR
jgi:hypothetical protein